MQMFPPDRSYTHTHARLPLACCCLSARNFDSESIPSIAVLWGTPAEKHKLFNFVLFDLSDFSTLHALPMPMVRVLVEGALLVLLKIVRVYAMMISERTFSS